MACPSSARDSPFPGSSASARLALCSTQCHCSMLAHILALASARAAFSSFGVTFAERVVRAEALGLDAMSTRAFEPA